MVKVVKHSQSIHIGNYTINSAGGWVGISYKERTFLIFSSTQLWDIFKACCKEGLPVEPLFDCMLEQLHNANEVWYRLTYGWILFGSTSATIKAAIIQEVEDLIAMVTMP